MILLSFYLRANKKCDVESKNLRELTAITSRSHQGIWSPPPKNEQTDSNNLPIFASMRSVDFADIRKPKFQFVQEKCGANLSEKEMEEMINEDEIEFEFEELCRFEFGI